MDALSWVVETTLGKVGELLCPPGFYNVHAYTLESLVAYHCGKLASMAWLFILDRWRTVGVDVGTVGERDNKKNK